MNMEKTNDIDTSNIKTHDEILELLNDIKSIEDRLIDIEIGQNNPSENEKLKKESQHIIETIEKINNPKNEENKGNFNHIKKKDNIEPNNSTFTLKINNQGNLVGLNIKKHKSKNERKSKGFLIKKISSSSKSEEKEPAKSTIKEKIKNIFSKIKKKSK